LLESPKNVDSDEVVVEPAPAHGDD
jgi:hypothetical protein